MGVRAKLVDVSSYQGRINFARLRDRGVVGVVLRSTVGASLKDTRYHEYYANAVDANLLVSTYIVINPLFTAQAHVANFKAHNGGRKHNFTVSMDVELAGGMKPAAVQKRVKESIDAFDQLFGYKTMVYTGKWFWDRYFVVNGRSVYWAREHDLWAAQYPFDLGNVPVDMPESRQPVLPTGWSTWKFWQWTSRWPHTDEVDSKGLDSDVFNGDEAALLAYSNLEVSEGLPKLCEHYELWWPLLLRLRG